MPGPGVGQALEELGGEGVQDGDGEERSANDLDGGRSHAGLLGVGRGRKSYSLTRP
jgi:hypothetical protein